MAAAADAPADVKLIAPTAPSAGGIAGDKTIAAAAMVEAVSASEAAVSAAGMEELTNGVVDKLASPVLVILLLEVCTASETLLLQQLEATLDVAGEAADWEVLTVMLAGDSRGDVGDSEGTGSDRLSF